MKTLRFLPALTLLFSCLFVIMESQQAAPNPITSSKYQYKQKNVEKLCRSKWTKRGQVDLEMFSYCLKKETEGYKNLVYLIQANSHYQWLPEILNLIWEDWTRQGVTSYEMVAHSLTEQIDAFLDYKYELKQSSLNRKKMSYCASEWNNSPQQWTMTMYCYKDR